MAKVSYTIKIEESVIEAVQARAKVENRSVNNMFETAIIRGLRVSAGGTRSELYVATMPAKEPQPD